MIERRYIVEWSRVEDHLDDHYGDTYAVIRESDACTEEWCRHEIIAAGSYEAMIAAARLLGD